MSEVVEERTNELLYQMTVYRGRGFDPIIPPLVPIQMPDCTVEAFLRSFAAPDVPREPAPVETTLAAMRDILKQLYGIDEASVTPDAWLRDVLEE
ncbi:MAG: hypothetical protein JXA57_11770 [Armatimonadetes bacterium]|nr:hypothetical protein [Armatimonadota bacterium]